MDLLELMLKRRSIREYTDEDIGEDNLNKIVTAGLLAPSSRNRKPCEFVVVQDKTILNKLSKSKKSGSAMLENANAAVVVIADSTKADTWIEDSSIALTYMDLMAAQLDIGSCWCQSHLRFSDDGISSEEVIKNILSLDDKYRVVGILSLGISENKPERHQLSQLDIDKVKYL
ncbi:MAG: nitroreductase [Methanosphaera stadtmanae]|nr:nitroreductase [Methanosphaera stadtmanae]